MQKSHDETPVSVLGSKDETLVRQVGFAGQPGIPGAYGPASANQCTGLYMLPLEYTISNEEPEVLLKPVFSHTFRHYSWLSISGRLSKRGFFKRDEVDLTKVGYRYTIDFDKQESALSGTVCMEPSLMNRMSNIRFQTYELLSIIALDLPTIFIRLCSPF